MPLCGECVNRMPVKPCVPCDASAATDHHTYVETLVAPAPLLVEVPECQTDVEEQLAVDVEEMATEEEADRILPEGSRRSLREEAASLFPQLRHKPKNPYCDTCRRTKL